MPIFDIICPICNEIFQNSDDIQSADCGHLFHLLCFNDWQRKERSCPQCRNMDPTTHKLHLGFDKFEKKSESRKDIQTKVESSEEKIADISSQVNEVKQVADSSSQVNGFKEMTCMFQKLRTRTEELMKNLEEKTDRLKNIENDFLFLLELYNETAERINRIEDRISEPNIKNRFESNGPEWNVYLSFNELDEKIKLHEMKLKHFSEELEELKIINNTLFIEQKKQESFINNFHSKENRGNIKLKPNKKKSRATKTKANKKCLKQNSYRSMNENGTSVFITGIPLGHVTLPLENVVLNLASKMDVSVSRKDLVKVTTVNNDVEMSSTVQLLVEFKSNEIKYKFLSNKESLRKNKTTETIIIEELMSEELRALFLYAKGKLQNSRLNYLFIKNNKIYAKSFESDSEIVQIQSKNQVDDLQKKCVYNQILQLTQNLSFQ